MTAPVAHNVQTSCAACGFVSKRTTAALARRALELHSCERHQRLAASHARGQALQDRIDRTPAPCHHKQAQHQHGYYATYVLDRCRCWPCVKAATAWKRNQVRKEAQGRWQPYVDATPAREHLQQLQAAGMGWKRIAEKGGVSSSTVCHLLYGKGGRPPTKRLRPATADMLLAVQLDLASSALVDATGTWRRLHALVAIGWPKAQLAARLGMNSRGLQIREHRVEAATATKVRALYDDLWDQPGPSSRARNMAEKHGWLAPLWWDDEHIDDPTYDPRTDIDNSAPTGLQEKRQERLRRVAALTREGLSATEIAARLGVTPRQIVRDRNDAQDLEVAS